MRRKEPKFYNGNPYWKNPEFEAFLIACPEDITITDLNGNILKTSVMALKLFGYTNEDELSGLNITEFLVPGDRERAIQNISSRLTGHLIETSQYRAIHKDGHEMDIEVSAGIIKNGDDVPSGLVFIVRDITQRKHLEERNRKIQFRLEKMGEIASIGGWEFEVQTGIQEWTKEVYRIHEVEDDFVPTVEDGIAFYLEEDRPIIQNAVVDAIERGLSFDHELRIQARDGTVKWVRAIGQPYWEDGKIISVFGVIQDITQQKESEKTLIESKEKAEESDRLKSAFLANMSHEIRTPMNGIIGFTELLKKNDLSGSEKDQFIEVIRKSGDRLLNIINDIIDISKIESGVITADNSDFLLDEVLDYLYDFFKPEAEVLNLNFSLVKPQDSLLILSDREKLLAILTNLIKNALKFTRSGFVEFGFTKEERMLNFYVKDSGTGIAPQNIGIIFERFRQENESIDRTYEGAGLGLAISKAYVELLGGTIHAESTPGKGSTFRFTIPWISGTHKPKAFHDIDVNVTQPPQRNLNIMIVEDDDASGMFLQLSLKKFYPDVFLTDSGAEAIHRCRQQKTDIIFLDLKMPVMSGFEVAKQIRTFDSDVIIIAQSAFAFQPDKEQAMAAGCDDFLTKPIVMQDVLAMISRYGS